MRTENGIAYPEGNLTLNQAVQVKEEGERLLASGVTIFDLSGLGQVDSAALSLFMNWRRSAQAHDHTIEFRNTPESLLSLAKLYGVAELVNLT
jgi:phospholipid transport system transporter-binding protein